MTYLVILMLGTLALATMCWRPFPPARYPVSWLALLALPLLNGVLILTLGSSIAWADFGTFLLGVGGVELTALWIAALRGDGLEPAGFAASAAKAIAGLAGSAVLTYIWFYVAFLVDAMSA